MRVLPTAVNGYAAIALLSIVGCSSERGSDHGGSAMITYSSSDDSVAFVSEEDGVVGRLDLATTSAPIRVLGGRPARLSHTDDRIYVSMRDQRRVLILDRALQTIDEIPVAAEPYGLVTDSGGKRLYVASSSSGVVEQVDVDARAVVRSWQLDDQPRWLALHPYGVLFVGCALNGTLYRIDVETGEVQRFELPEKAKTDLSTGERLPLVGRVTGDPVIATSGEMLIVPATFNDVTSVIVASSETTPAEGSEDGYSKSGRFNAGAVMYSLSATADLIGTPEIVALEMELGDRVVNAFPASVAISPDGTVALAAIEAADLVFAFTTAPSASLGPNFDERGFSRRRIRALATGQAPRGLAIADDRRAFVINAVGRSIQAIDLEAIESELEDGATTETLPTEVAPALGSFPSQLDPAVDLGRQLFHAGNDLRTSSDTADVACSFCHFDGRSDGLTRVFEHGQRQTPSLAGPVSMTEPVRWQGEAPTVVDSIRYTTERLMGGVPTDEALEALAAYVNWTPDVDSPMSDSPDPCVDRGAEIFRRTEVGCTECHNGERFTDNSLHDLLGLTGVKTRSLVGISDSPPYFHDGSAPTLEAVVLRARTGAMGDTSSLSDGESQDLICYLRSL